MFKAFFMFIGKVVLQIFNLIMLNKVIIMYFLIVLSGSSQENRNRIRCFYEKHFNIGNWFRRH